MSKGHSGGGGDSRRREAVEWFAAHESGQEMTPEKLPLWDAWMDDVQNRDEYTEVVRLHHEAHVLPRPPLPSRMELLEDDFDITHPPAASVPAASTPSGDTPSVERSWGARFKGWQRTAAIAATGLLALATVAFLSARTRLLSSPAVEPGRAYATRAGEQRQFGLVDGSTMTLGGDSAAVVRFTAAGRTVTLTRGEGMFNVQHDAGRPFLVCAAQACVRALGTVFDVRLYSNRVHVWVAEGTVEIAPVDTRIPANEVSAEAPRWSPLRLAHGQQMSYDASGEASAPGPADSRVAAEWTQGTLIYRGRPLTEVIEDVQRYSQRPLLLDPALAGLHYSGSVIQQHVDQWIHGLSDIFPIDIVDCRAPRESAAADAHVIPASCSSNTDRILIRPRATP